MTDTPRCDALNDETIDFRRYGKLWELARALERELAAALADLATEKREHEQTVNEALETHRQLAAAKKDAERYRLLRLGASNTYPIPFIAVRDPSSTVIQLSGEFADEQVDMAIGEQISALKSIIKDAAIEKERK